MTRRILSKTASPRPDGVGQRYRKAEETELPVAKDDQVWCTLRTHLVDASTCMSDGCLDPSMRVVCWHGKVADSVDVDVP